MIASFQDQVVDGVIVLIVTSSDTTDALAIRRAGEAMYARVRRDPSPRVVIDFSHVTTFSSTWLAVIGAMRSKLDQRGGQVRLTGLSDEARRILRLTAGRTWRPDPSRESAVSALAAAG